VLIDVRVPRGRRRCSASTRSASASSTTSRRSRPRFALDVRPTDAWRARRLAYGGIAATPIRATALEQALVGQPWTPETPRRRSIADGIGTPMTDLRGSADYRARCRPAAREVRRRHAPAAEPVGVPMNKPIAPIASARLVGAALPHESAIGHVTGARATSTTCGPTSRTSRTHGRCSAPHAHARVVRIDADAARNVPGVLAVLTADDVPGENDTVGAA
jgi:xanthine dehydrogenase large subunit